MYATIENMEKMKDVQGVFAYSPYTGEKYSANPSDYWNVPKGWRMRDSTKHVMRLVVRYSVIEDLHD